MAVKVKDYKKVGILGISFKPDSPVVIGSPSARLIKDLLELGATVNGFDKIKESYQNLDVDINEFDDAQQCVNESEVVVIMHPDKTYSNLNYSNKSVVDYWGVV